MNYEFLFWLVCSFSRADRAGKLKIKCALMRSVEHFLGVFNAVSVDFEVERAEFTTAHVTKVTASLSRSYITLRGF